MRGKLLCIYLLVLLLAGGSVQEEVKNCEGAFFHVEKRETYCYVASLYNKTNMMEKGYNTSFDAVSSCGGTAVLYTKTFKLKPLSINSDEEAWYIRAFIDKRIEEGKGGEPNVCIAAWTDGRFLDGSDNGYVKSIFEQSEMERGNCLMLSADGSFAVLSCMSDYGDKSYWTVCKGRQKDALHPGSSMPVVITCGCAVVRTSTDSNETFCYRFHLLHADLKFRKRQRKDDYHYGKAYCSRRITFGDDLMDNQTCPSTLLSINSLEEEYFILRHISKRSQHRENLHDEVLLGIDRQGGWLDGSDTAYVRERFDIDKLRGGRNLYLVNRQAYSSRRGSDVEDLKRGRKVWIVCKGRVNQTSNVSFFYEEETQHTKSGRALRGGTGEPMDSRIRSTVVTLFVVIFILTFL